jgi:hypothetical protein
MPDSFVRELHIWSKNMGNFFTEPGGARRHPEHQSHFKKSKSELRQERKDTNLEQLFQSRNVKNLSPMTIFEK